MKPLILITNDDGIYSPGLLAVVETVIHIGDIVVAAPMTQQTSMGRSFPKGPDVGIIKKIPMHIDNEEITAYGICGSPAQAVSHAILELCDRKPDLCISGINYGENLGLSITCSGTVGAAFEADSHGIPSIAISLQADLSIQHLENYADLDWSICKHVLMITINDIINKGFPEGVSILNINVPDGATMLTPFRVTMQSRHNYSSFVKPSYRMFDIGYRLKSEIDLKLNDIDKASDIYAIVFDKVISITPLTWNLSVNLDPTWKGSMYEK